MTSLTGESGAEPFFLKSGVGQRFCLYHRPAGICRGAVLYVHPFAEELNRSRRMAALQARALAALGYGVLQIDLYGCGDSSGDFGDARWDLWKQDLDAAAAWLHQRLDQPIVLWGLRLGALLALDYVREARHRIGAMLLWQPILNGANYLTQFLRLRMASAMLADSAQTSTRSLREALQAGDILEIGGYELAPELAAALDAVAPAEAMPPFCPAYWFEAVASSGLTPSPAAVRVSAEWQRQGVDVQLHAIQCPPFWATPEITVSPAWLAATADVLHVSAHEC